MPCLHPGQPCGWCERSNLGKACKPQLASLPRQPHLPPLPQGDALGRGQLRLHPAWLQLVAEDGQLLYLHRLR